MNLAEIGEFGLISRLASQVGCGGIDWIGIGDDCAVWHLDNHDLVMTTDSLVETLHFRRDFGTWEDVGWKAMTANLSDLASAGAAPRFALVALSIPHTVDVNDLERLYAGFTGAAAPTGAKIAGGDIAGARSDLLTMTLTLIGICAPGRALLRTAARPGDDIYVSGVIGDSAAGLALLCREPAESRCARLLQAHRRPIARCDLGMALGKLPHRVACMDLSDGFGGDLPKLCAASGVGAEIVADALPVSDELHEAATLLDVPYIEWALSGGEDYELLFTAPPDARDDIAAIAVALNFPCTRIGTIRPSDQGVTLLHPDGSRHDLHGGWDHFRSR